MVQGIMSCVILTWVHYRQILAYLDIYIYIQNHPSVLILSAVHHEVFTAGALEARVCRTSAFRAPAGKTE